MSDYTPEMRDQDLRMECLRLAAQQNFSAAEGEGGNSKPDTLALAEKFYGFVKKAGVTS